MRFVLKNYFAFCILIGMAGCHLKTNESKESDDLDTDGMEEAMRQEFIMTRDPKLNTIPRERLEIAKQYARSVSNGPFRTMALAWQERGPSNIGGRTRTIM